MKNNSPNGFSYKSTKDGKVFIYRNSKHAMILKGSKASELLLEISGANEEESQMILAIITGQFKFGNEGEDKITRETKRYT